MNHNHNHNHGHCDHHHGHYNNKIKLIFVIFFNIIITIAEFIGGVLSGSLALISDAWHNLSDVLSLMLSYAGEKVSDLDRNKKYSFGFKRFEVLIALINAISLFMIGIFIVYEAIMRFINPVTININIMIPIAFIGLAGNFFSIFVLLKNRKSNLNMKAAFLHLLYDAISSVAVIIAGIILYFTKVYWIDLLISIIIVIMMVWSSMGIISESLRIFLQGTPEHIDADEVYKLILGSKNVSDVHGLHIWSISSKEIFLSCHICIDNKINIDTDEIIREVNSILKDTYNIEHTALQIEMDQLCKLDQGECCK